eukprot:CFRG5210T1
MAAKGKSPKRGRKAPPKKVTESTPLELLKEPCYSEIFYDPDFWKLWLCVFAQPMYMYAKEYFGFKNQNYERILMTTIQIYFIWGLWAFAQKRNRVRDMYNHQQQQLETQNQSK